MQYRIRIKEWSDLILYAEDTTSYNAACKLACELSIRVPNVIFSVDRWWNTAARWHEESQWRNGQ